MKIDFDMLDEMVAAGANGAVIVAYLRKQDARQAPRRDADKLRKRAERQRKRADTVRTTTDNERKVAELTPSQIAEKDLFTRGKAILGKTSGGMISNLLRFYKYDLAVARAVVEEAATKSDPREWVVASMRGSNVERNPTMAAFDRLIARAKSEEIAGDPPMRDITPGRASGG